MNLRIKYWNANLPAEMYDFSTKEQLLEHSLIIKETTEVYKNELTYELNQTNDLPKNGKNYSEIAKIIRVRKNRFVIKKCADKEEMCIVVNKFNDSVDPVDIKQGSMIKLGKSRLQVVKIKISTTKFIQQNGYK